ncbi:MAG: hypothetical protein MZU97_16370 [Bacillus subtilis]|nr:hypothetical protein [Bacillus subtilis]
MINLDSFVLDLQAPVVFGPKHIAGSVAIGVMIAVLLIDLVCRCEKQKARVEFENRHASFYLRFELIKYSHALVTEGSFPVHYIPMQLCSFSLYLMPMVSFGKGKLRDVLSADGVRGRLARRFDCFGCTPPRC